MALPQILIAQGSFDTALDKLAALIQEAEVTGHGSLLIKALVLQALAFHTCGNNSQALTSLERALTLAEPEGYIRPFVDEGAPMAELLGRMNASREGGRLKEYVHKLLATFGVEEQRRRGAGVQETSPSPLLLRSSASLLVDPLSERELELLSLVAAGRSNQEIAQELFLAIGTVKKHLNNLFSKKSGRGVGTPLKSQIFTRLLQTKTQEAGIVFST